MKCEFCGGIWFKRITYLRFHPSPTKKGYLPPSRWTTEMHFTEAEELKELEAKDAHIVCAQCNKGIKK